MPSQRHQAEAPAVELHDNIRRAAVELQCSFAIIKKHVNQSRDMTGGMLEVMSAGATLSNCVDKNLLFITCKYIIYFSVFERHNTA